MRTLKNGWFLTVLFLNVLVAVHFGPSNVLALEPKGELKTAIAISYSADWLDPSRNSTYSSHYTFRFSVLGRLQLRQLPRY